MSRAGRLIDLVQLLSGRRSRRMGEIVEHCGVSERTIYRDLAELNAQSIPVVHDDHGYRLLETATIRPLNLTAEEHAVLRLVLADPAILRQTALRRHLATLQGKLDAATRQLEESPIALRLAGPERSGEVPAGVAEGLQRAIVVRKACDILYCSLSRGDRRWRGVDPYAVFHRAGAWYVAGRCHVHDEPRTFRLDRIEDLRAGSRTFVAPADFDLDAYLADTWSIERGPRVHDVVVDFDRSLAALVEHGRHHPRERVRRRKDGSVEYRVRTSSLDEIARWVLGFGGRAVAVEPIELVGRIRELAEATLDAHARPGGTRNSAHSRRGSRDPLTGTDRS